MKITIAKNIVIIEKLKELISSNQKINLTELERTYGVTRKTIRKFRDGIVNDINFEIKKRVYNKPKTSYLEKHKEFLDERIKHYESNGINGSKPSMFAIYNMFKNYCCEKENILKNDFEKIVSFATFRKFLKRNYKYTSFKTTPPKICFKETLPGEYVEIDWKENMKLTFKDGSYKTINVLILKLPFSRKISLHLTFDRKVKTIMKAIIFGFIKFKGVPKTLVCDNMKTIVIKNNGFNQTHVINSEFNHFASDFKFSVKPCSPYSPQQKGKVESSVRIINRIKAYSGLINNVQELVELIKELENDYNSSVNNSNGLIPEYVFKTTEQKELQKLPNKDLVDDYLSAKEFKTVKKDCSISYLSNIYYVDPEYINKDVEIWKEKDAIYIKYNNKIIKKYENVDVLKHKFIDFKTQVNILIYQYQQEGFEINMDEISEKAKNTLKSLDIQYSLKKKINISDFDKLL